MIEETKQVPGVATDGAQWEKPILSRIQADEAEGATGNGGDAGVFS